MNNSIYETYCTAKSASCIDIKLGVFDLQFSNVFYAPQMSQESNKINSSKLIVHESRPEMMQYHGLALSDQE